MTKPYNLMLHYDETKPRSPVVYVGTGRLMNPACGQSEEIGVTARQELVECTKCQRIIETREAPL